MKIGLLDIDSHNFPNLALMKLSAWHKSNGDSVEFASIFNEYDIIYKSKIFTFTPDDITNYKTKKIIEGGTGYKKYNWLDYEIEHIKPDYDLYNCQHAYGFLTRGCIRKCNFCIVPKKEGNIKSHSDIEEFLDNKKTAILLDNNILASEHGLNQIEKIIKLGIKVDFNQGLDCKIIAKNKNIAKLLSQVKWLKPLRMACDHESQIEPLIKAVELLRKYNTKPKNYFIYIMVKNIKEVLNRIELCKKYGLTSFCQPYIEFKDNKIIDKELNEFCRWVNIKNIHKRISFEKFKLYRSGGNCYEQKQELAFMDEI